MEIASIFITFVMFLWCHAPILSCLTNENLVKCAIRQMTQIIIMRLNLLSPIHFSHGDRLDPFNPGLGDGEKLFCFDLDETQNLSFEPDKARLLGNQVFGGANRELPKGDYLFAQEREILSREEIISLAAEIQQEGLWQRLIPGKRLYLRYLYEDGSWVTQLYRPYTESMGPGTGD